VFPERDGSGDGRALPLLEAAAAAAAASLCRGKVTLFPTGFPDLAIALAERRLYFHLSYG